MNYATVNVPFALGNTYDHSFSRFEGWTFDPGDLHRPPFFPGPASSGVKYLKSPEIAPGVEAGLTLFGTTTNGGGDFNDPRDVTQLYRYISGEDRSGRRRRAVLVRSAGDDHICFIRQTSPRSTCGSSSRRAR